MNQPDYRDFYPKSLIPIGLNDQMKLKRLQNINDGTFQATHWLVALQGVSKSPDLELFQWQVYVFPADLEGSYTWEQPFYVSNLVDSLEKAIELSSELEVFGRDDAILSSNIKEIIS
jgi:hypothetical protein